MRSILFHIPTALTLGDWRVPLFGTGLLLFALVALAGVALGRVARQQGFAAALAGLGPGILVLGSLVVLAPWLDDGAGIPVRGFGVMMLAAAAAGVWLSVRRGRAAGFDADTIVGLGFWIFVAGLLGARLFYVIEYHDDFFQRDTSSWQSLAAVLNIAQGGLVVFGALPTAALAAWWYARRHRLDLLRLADVIAPGLLVGLAIGRVGCFLNGCCYGGPTDLPWGVSFPAGSPPAFKYPDAAAGGASVPLHPAQLYAAVDAAILALVAVAFTPLCRRAGEVFALVLTLHPLSRILLEVIRVDEPPALGTPLSISQLVSLVLLGLAAGLWWRIARQPPPEAARGDRAL